MGWRFSGLPFDFQTFVQAPEGSPAIPRLIAVVGASFGDSALHAAMGHYVVMTKDSAIALSGPPVIAAAIGEELTADELGGPKVSTRDQRQRPPRRRRRAGGDRRDPARALLPPGLGRPPRTAAARRRAGPRRRRAAHARAQRPEARLRHAQGAGGDLRRGQHPAVGREATAPACSAAWRGSKGRRSGVVASQPMQRAGVMDVPALDEGAAFVDLCDTFNLPLVFLQDVPGLMIGSDAERGGILGGYERVVARLARAKRAEDRRRRPQGLRRRPLRARRPADAPRPRPRLADRRDGLHGAGDRRPHRLPPPARGDARAARARRRTTRSSRSCPPTGRASPSPGRPQHRTSRRRDRPAPHARGDRRRASTSRGAAGPASAHSTLTREEPMPAGPFAHVCSRRQRPRQGDRGLAKILAELDPGQLEEPIVLVERWEAGEDIMASATFVNPSGWRSSCSRPAQRRPARPPAREARRGVHHICFTAPDLPDAVAASSTRAASS